MLELANLLWDKKNTHTHKQNSVTGVSLAARRERGGSGC